MAAALGFKDMRALQMALSMPHGADREALLPRVRVQAETVIDCSGLTEYFQCSRPPFTSATYDRCDR